MPTISGAEFLRFVKSADILTIGTSDWMIGSMRYRLLVTFSLNKLHYPRQLLFFSVDIVKACRLEFYLEPK